jgi:hypothetical protein
LVCRQLGRGLDLRLGGPGQRHHRRSRRQQSRFRLPDQTHKDFPLAAALPPKAAHDLGKIELELLRLRLQGRALGTAMVRTLRNDLEDFFFALYKVAASLTRWLPCSLGKVSTTKWAGLTTPSIAAAACSATSSSSTGSSRRLRNWVNSSPELKE